MALRAALLSGAVFALYAVFAAGTAVAAVDLSVTKSDNPDPARVGSDLTYMIAVRNDGDEVASGVTVTDELPKAVTFQSASPGCAHDGGDPTGGTVTCDLDTIGVGETETVQIVVVPNEPRNIRNTASATAAAYQEEANSNDNSDAERTDVDPAAALTCAGQEATIVDPDANDGSVIVGTRERDVIVALGGNDTIRGRAGNDVICANGGDDTARGGGGDDAVRGGGANDVLRGGRGLDSLRGKVGDDELFGGSRRDRLGGGAGIDACTGGSGKDKIRNCEG